MRLGKLQPFFLKVRETGFPRKCGLEPEIIRNMTVLNDVVAWKCHTCGREFNTPHGGVCKECGKVICNLCLGLGKLTRIERSSLQKGHVCGPCAGKKVKYAIKRYWKYYLPFWLCPIYLFLTWHLIARSTNLKEVSLLLFVPFFACWFVSHIPHYQKKIPLRVAFTVDFINAGLCFVSGMVSMLMVEMVFSFR